MRWSRRAAHPDARAVVRTVSMFRRPLLDVPLAALPADASKPLPAPLVRKVFCILFPLPMLGYGISFIDRSNLSFAPLDDHLAHDVPGIERVYGLAAGLFFLGYGILQAPVVHLLSRVGARRVSRPESSNCPGPVVPLRPLNSPACSHGPR